MTGRSWRATEVRTGGAPPPAALGGEMEVPTLDGRVKLKIPKETQTGKVFRFVRARARTHTHARAVTPVC